MEIYALKWVQTNRISPVEAYTDKSKAERNAKHNNRNVTPFQRVLRRYWKVVTINVVKGP
jgi:hypothetical protein